MTTFTIFLAAVCQHQRWPAGDGHFSPIGAYHAGKDAALILDTARFKYNPHWVGLQELHAAQAAIDPATGHCRGYIKLSASQQRDSTLFTLDVSSEFALLMVMIPIWMQARSEQAHGTRKCSQRVRFYHTMGQFAAGS